MNFETLRYEVDGRVARVTLNRPERGNAINTAMPRELEAAVEAADVDPRVHVIALSGAGSGFCGGYDLREFAEGAWEGNEAGADAATSVLDSAAQRRNHDPARCSSLPRRTVITSSTMLPHWNCSNRC